MKHLNFLVLTFSFFLLPFTFSLSFQAHAEGTYTVEFKNSDLKETLNFLAEAARMNVMIPESVSGTVNASFKNVSLEDAINSIIKANGLDYTVEKGVYRIGKTEEFTTAGEDLKTEAFRLKFATAKDMVEKVKTLLTERGSVMADERTNSLVVRERLAGIENVRRFIDKVDIRDPQVLIESKIVEATRSFSRNLGVQWGVTSTGTRVDVTGVEGVGQADSERNLNVNLPTASPTSGIGMIIGSLGGGTTIDLAITAAEEKGDARIISEPSIVTSNGIPARIRSGETMYVKGYGDVTIGTGGASTTTSSNLQEIQTGVELNVTPQISDDGYIKLKIDVKTSQPDFSRTVDGIPVIVDNTASTQVLVKDADITVIGGLAKFTGSTSRKGVPFFSRVPLFGNLFKSKARSKRNTELMVFIKPTIVRVPEDIPANAAYGEIEEMKETMVIPKEESRKKPARKHRKFR